jgi:hypothetical protein
MPETVEASTDEIGEARGAGGGPPRRLGDAAYAGTT